MYDEEFLKKLKTLCLDYDKSAGEYPESPYEGFALYFFATHPGFTPNSFGVSIYDKEGGEEYLKELEGD